MLRSEPACVPLRPRCRPPRIVAAAFALSLCRCGSPFLADGPVDAEGAPAAAAVADATDGPYYIAVRPDGGAEPDPDDATTEPDATTEADATSDATAFDAPIEAAADTSDATPDAVASADAFVCDPTLEPKSEPCAIADAYAVFVASAANMDAGTTDGGAATTADAGSPLGSMANPAPTVSQGIALAGATRKSRVYVCGGQYAESVAITSGVGLYGGFSCAQSANGPSWRWTAATTTVIAETPIYALSVNAPGATVVIEDLVFSSPDAIGQDSSGNGLSSVAAFVNASTVSFVRTTLSAGSGARGADGVTGIRLASGTIVATNYQPAGTSAQPSVAPGGTLPTPGSIVCNYEDPTRLPLAPDSSMGGGGDGPLGGVGTSNPPPVITAATPPSHDGLGIPTAGTNQGPDVGEDGPARPGGAAAAMGGSLTSSNGWTPSGGADGPAGQPGQGGGGIYIPCPSGNCPPSAGGGSGGCGGAGGTGGGGGGSSIALMSLSSAVTLSASSLVARAGGNGGAGGNAQVGQAGGPGINTFGGASAGGGNGAGGSGGAGGSAGVSVGILYAQSAVPSFSSADTLITYGNAGTPGPGGQPGMGPGAVGNPGATGYVASHAAATYLLAP
jgi:hypothetical protein